MQPMEQTYPKLDALRAKARAKGRLTVSVAYPCSNDSLAAALSARDDGVIDPILVGPRSRMQACADALQVSLDGVRVVEAPDDPVKASRAAVALVSSGEAKALMKGSQHSDQLLAAALTREADLRTGRRMSHVFWFDLPNYHKPLMVTDAVVNIAPTLQEKVDILHNAIELSHAIGLPEPKIALLSAIETVSVGHVSSMDAAALSKMADRGQIPGAIIDGPLAFDNAISAASAANKGIDSPVAGDPDMLLVPNLDVGNVLYKSFIYMGRGECAGLVLGAKVPIILTSRSDSRRARVASCALAQLSLG
ncbi:bifunctional enoyl-CoA hydratase/phosphate acetyltransferase [Rhodopseudomonas sp. B29]|uniref:bifunctional enoyl-CoA hydratase/phosphate acetyltransferase n=1 Tax=Rhodopseudomonas sp. B29 TaxID=95607 RepID=UPI000345C01B|nr:bifunctional enoyl-CoA hydratase/phosphate acetyltransferase [Rhodopseudomonas sp. B29]